MLEAHAVTCEIEGTEARVDPQGLGCELMWRLNPHVAAVQMEIFHPLFFLFILFLKVGRHMPPLKQTS